MVYRVNPLFITGGEGPNGPSVSEEMTFRWTALKSDTFSHFLFLYLTIFVFFEIST